MYPVAAKKVIKFSPFYYKLTQAVLFSIFKVCFDFKIYGTEKVPDDGRGIIFAPNHASYLDPPALGISFYKPISFFGKEYLFKVFAFGRTLHWLGVLPVKGDSDEFRSMRQIMRALKEGKRLVIFPEGTRTSDGNFQEVEVGAGFLAIKSDAYVVPVYIRGSFDAFPRTAKWIRCKPVRVYYGKAFIPSQDAELMAASDPYLAVSQRVMTEIKKIKADVDQGIYGK